MTLLACTNLSKSFQKQNQTLIILKQINLTVKPGERVVITGKSGAGKSVLLSLVSGMDRPSSGDIQFDGQSYQALSDDALNRLRIHDIGLIFQNLNLINSWTVLENVEAGMLGLSETKQSRRDIAITWLENVGLKDRLDHLPEHLSMGEQQRVAVVRTLIRKPRLIVADEPTGDLDNETAEIIIRMLNDAAREKKAALLVATHGNYPASQADRILHLENGVLHPIAE